MFLIDCYIGVFSSIKMSHKYLLASHGSTGGIAAEQAAIHICQLGDEIDHLYVIPDWWKGMTGDDWLNNGVSRNRFRNYLSEQLWQESQRVIKRIQEQCKRNSVRYNSLIQIGRSDQIFQQAAESKDYTKLIIGEHRPKYSDGLYDRMLTSAIRKQFATRLEVIPHPHV